MYSNSLRSLMAIALLQGLVLPTAMADSGKAAPAPNGITLPADYVDWRLIAPSYRTDKHHVRAILGNDKAIQAARTGQTKPWPDGAILAKVAWRERAHERFPVALEADQFNHVEIMVKDSKRYAETGGWGYARWLGNDLKPYGNDASFVQECHGCHTPMADNDYVFTAPVKLP